LRGWLIWFCWLVDPGRVGDLQDLGRGGSGEAFGVSAARGDEDCLTVTPVVVGRPYTFE